MGCCNGNNSHQENGHNGNSKKHMSHNLMMVICCGAPIILLLLLPLLGRIIPGTSNYLSKIIPFLCPVMMVIMLPMMFKKEHRDGENKSCENKRLEDKV